MSKINTKYFKYIILFFPVLIGVIFLFRFGYILFSQYLAGSIFERVTNQEISNYSCEISALSNSENRQLVAKANDRLQKAIQISSKSAQLYLLLGKGYCLIGDTNKAIQAFDQFVALRPDNPLGYLERGFAEMRACHEEYAGVVSSESAAMPGGYFYCPDYDDREHVVSELADQKISIDKNTLLIEARASFVSADYQMAYQAFQRIIIIVGQSSNDIEASDRYKLAISAIMSGTGFPESLQGLVPITTLDESVELSPEFFHWFRDNQGVNIIYGDFVTPSVQDNRQVVLMYWGGAVGGIVEVQNEGWYNLSISAKNTPPSPVILEIEDNLQSIFHVEINLDDNSWETLEKKVFLSKGFHIITVRYTNDEKINGVDRNAVFQDIQLVRIK